MPDTSLLSSVTRHPDVLPLYSQQQTKLRPPGQSLSCLILPRKVHIIHSVCLKRGSLSFFSLPFRPCLWLQSSPFSLLSPAAHCLSPKGPGNDPPHRQEADCEYTWCAMVSEFFALPLNTAKASVCQFGWSLPQQWVPEQGRDGSTRCPRCANLILSSTAGKGRYNHSSCQCRPSKVQVWTIRAVSVCHQSCQCRLSQFRPSKLSF